MRVLSVLPAAVMALTLSSAVFAEDAYTITIKDHRFTPERLVVPAGQKVKVTVDNQDASPEEFESYELNREKIVGAGRQAVIFVGPLKKGEYKYFGEFHSKTAQGVIAAE